MRINTYTSPKSSFLSLEKDMNIIVEKMMKNERLKKLLYYNTKDALTRPNLTEEQSIGLYGKNIKTLPKLYIDTSVENYIVISFDNFTRNNSNPEFRNNIIEFDIVCHYDCWQLKDFQLRPYRIAAELDSLLDKQHLTGIGELEFSGGNIIVLSDEMAGVCLQYSAIHGEEDKTRMPNPNDEAQFLKDFNTMING